MHEGENAVVSPSGTFYCWECVSVITPTRTIDFVIKKRSHMMAFLSIMTSYLNQIYRQRLLEKKIRKKNFFGTLFTRVPKVELRPVNMLYYKILMLKMKISFMAWDQ